MCGRFQLTLPVEALRRLFEFGEAEPYPPRYNIAPTQPVHVVAPDPKGGRRLALMRWGFLPSWVKDPNDFPLLINARAETAAEKPAFRNALRRRRVLLPATGFYEWRREGKAKMPVLFEPDEPMALAGVFETWCGPDGEEIDTVAILTTSAEGAPAAVHDRMPLTVPAGAWALWLDAANDDGAEALSLARRASYRPRPVSRLLSNARNEGAGLMEPDVETDTSPERRPRAVPAEPDLFGGGA